MSPRKFRSYTSALRIALSALGMVAFAASASEADRSSRTESCGVGFEKLAPPKTLNSNLEKLSKGTLIVTDVKTGEKFSLSARLDIRDDPDPKLLQKTKLAEMRFVTTAVDGKVSEAGFIRVRYKTETKELEISNMATFPNFQRQGLSTLAITEAIKSFPDTKFITASLVGSNASEFMAGLRAARISGNRQSIEFGFKATPIYKAVEISGFSEIDMNHSFYDPNSLGMDQLYLRVRKPNP